MEVVSFGDKEVETSPVTPLSGGSCRLTWIVSLGVYPHVLPTSGFYTTHAVAFDGEVHETTCASTPLQGRPSRYEG